MPKGVPEQVKRNCRVCRKRFKAASNRQIYCGYECSLAARRSRRSPVQTAAGESATTVEELNELVRQEREKNDALRRENYRLQEAVIRSVYDHLSATVGWPGISFDDAYQRITLDLFKGQPVTEEELSLILELLGEEERRQIELSRPATPYRRSQPIRSPERGQRAGELRVKLGKSHFSEEQPLIPSSKELPQSGRSQYLRHHARKEAKPYIDEAKRPWAYWDKDEDE
ncbi:hypothetical protein [Glutamicibacter sp. BW77]|uniref:hypothetical protein n=1 Tax=Glutamicibacter TaxID=1742989 RepID=UPI0011442B49|nr:hypothetical protein [Glutamicibacter sp. BW77]